MADLVVQILGGHPLADGDLLVRCDLLLDLLDRGFKVADLVLERSLLISLCIDGLAGASSPSTSWTIVGSLTFLNGHTW